MPPLLGLAGIMTHAVPRLSPWARLRRPCRGLRCKTPKLALMGRCPRLSYYPLSGLNEVSLALTSLSRTPFGGSLPVQSQGQGVASPTELLGGSRAGVKDGKWYFRQLFVNGQ